MRRNHVIVGVEHEGVRENLPYRSPRSASRARFSLCLAPTMASPIARCCRTRASSWTRPPSTSFPSSSARVCGKATTSGSLRPAQPVGSCGRWKGLRRARALKERAIAREAQHLIEDAECDLNPSMESPGVHREVLVDLSPEERDEAIDRETSKAMGSGDEDHPSRIGAILRKRCVKGSVCTDFAPRGWAAGRASSTSARDSTRAQTRS